MRRFLTAMVLAGVLVIALAAPSLAHPRHNSCDGLTRASFVTHERDPHGHDVVHSIITEVGC